MITLLELVSELWIKEETTPLSRLKSTLTGTSLGSLGCSDERRMWMFVRGKSTFKSVWYGHNGSIPTLVKCLANVECSPALIKTVRETPV